MPLHGYNRQKLKAHDAGHDRHHKGMAYKQKLLRLAQLHHGRPKPLKQKTGRKPQ